jgi:hypothetical protein
MLKRFIPVLCLAGASLVAAPGEARAQQTFNVTVGAFVPQGADARVTGDVLNANRTFLAFDLRDFTSGTIGGEWLVPFGPYVEGGVGASFSRRTVPSVYADYVDRDGSEIEQDLRLRLVPVALTVRVSPFGRSSPVQPYLGGGVALVSWRYSEAGEFVDFGAGRAIFRDRYVANGTQPGAVVLGGIRFGGGGATGGFEIRHQHAVADLDERFAGSRIDLGGWTYQATFGVRF